MFRVLKDGGIIIITTPNFMTWTNRVKFILVIFSIKIRGCSILDISGGLPMNI